MREYVLNYLLHGADSFLISYFVGSQEIRRFSRNPNVHHRTQKLLPHVFILGQSNPVHITTSDLLEIHPNFTNPSTPVSPVVSFPPVSPRRPYTLPYRNPHAPYAKPISFFSILSHAQYWVIITEHLAPRYAISSIPQLPRLSYVQVFSSVPISQTTAASFPPAMSATKFHTHTKQQARLYFYIF